MLNKYNYLYNGEESILNIINPVVKLFGLFVYFILILLKFNYLLFMINIGIVFVLILISNVSFKKYIYIIWKLKYFLILLYLCLYCKNLELIEINMIVFKIMFLILYFNVILFTTSKEDLGKGISIIINMVNLIGIPFKGIMMFIINIYSFIEYFFDTYNDYLLKMEKEGINYLDSNILNKLVFFIKNFKNIWQISKLKLEKRKKELKYRLFDKNRNVKYKYRRRLCFFDYFYVLIYISLIFYYIVQVR